MKRMMNRRKTHHPTMVVRRTVVAVVTLLLVAAVGPAQEEEAGQAVDPNRPPDVVTLEYRAGTMDRYEVALRSYLKRDYERAAELAQATLTYEPDCIEASWLLANIYHKTGQLGLMMEEVGELGVREALESQFAYDIVNRGARGYVIDKVDSDEPAVSVGEDIYVDLTDADGVQEGAVLVLYQEGDVLTHPVTFEILNVDQSKKAEAEVQYLSDTFSVARITAIEEPFAIDPDTGDGEEQAAVTETREIRAMLKSQFENYRYQRELAQAESTPEQPSDEPAFEPISLGDAYDGTELSDPEGFVIGTDGSLFVADTGNNRVVKLNADREFVATVGFQGSGPDEFQTPVDVTIFQDRVVVVDRGNHRLNILDQDLNPQQIAGSRGTGTPGRFTTPTKVVSYRGQLYVHDSGNNRVQVFDGNFEPTEVQFPITGAEDTTTSFTIVPRQYLVVLDYAGGQAIYYDLDSPGAPLRTEELPDEIAGRQISDVTFVNLQGTAALAYTLDRDHQVAVVNAETQELITTIGRRGTRAGTFNQPIQVRSEADSLIVLERRNNRLQVIRDLP